jgi:regulator of sigma E protease
MIVRLLYILLAILFFGIMVAIHEFGHFFTAKLLGVKVNEFAIGMGPAFFSKTKGETQYSLRAFPIGGYCAMEGEDEQTGDPRAFVIQPWWKKLIILAAGSVMNFLLGAVIILLLYTGVSAVRAPVITELADGFPLSGESGLMEGDRIISIDGHRIFMYSDVLTFLSRNDGNGMDITVRRNGETVILKNLPMERFEYEYEGETYTGFGLVFGSVETLNLWGRVKTSVAQTVDFVRLVWLSLCDLLAGQVSVSELSGVIGIVDTVSEVGAASVSVLDGLMNVLYFVAFISVNLAVMNMLPLPALDGGRIFFVVINGIVYLFSRKNIPAKYEGYVHTAGFALLLVLMVVVAFHDVWKIIFA